MIEIYIQKDMYINIINNFVSGNLKPLTFTCECQLDIHDIHLNML